MAWPGFGPWGFGAAPPPSWPGAPQGGPPPGWPGAPGWPPHGGPPPPNPPQGGPTPPGMQPGWPNPYAEAAPQAPGRGRPKGNSNVTLFDDDEEVEVKNTARGAALGLPPVPRYDDDKNKISNAYKALGLQHEHGKTRCTATRFRISLITSCNSDDYPHLRLSQLSSEYVDMLLYQCAKILPNTKPSDLGAANKRDARLAVRKQYEVRLARGRARFDEIAEDFSNLPQIAVRDGYPLSMCTTETRQRLRTMGLIQYERPSGDESRMPPETPAASLAVARGAVEPATPDHKPRALMNGTVRSPAVCGSVGVAAQAELTPRGDEEEEPLPAAKRAKLAEPETRAENAEKDEEPPAKKMRLALPKLNLPCLPSQSSETSALRRRREKAEDAGEDNIFRKIPDVD